MRTEGKDNRLEEKEYSGRRTKGAQTFRRGRALEFYRQLETKKTTLTKQLEVPELQSIHPIIAGELKATEAIMNDFVSLFQLDELVEDMQQD